MRLRLAALVVLEFLLSAIVSPAQTATSSSSPSNSPARPSFNSLRYEEDWSFLRDPKWRTDYLDAIKYIPLGKRARWYLSVGGEIRPYYELFRNEDWGAAPEDGNGFLLQRYMLHADLHLGKRWRFFGQLKSGIEVGRMGGPRPPDEDQLDVHQAFVDHFWRLDEGRSVVLRAGRQELNFGSARLVTTREGPNVRQRSSKRSSGLGTHNTSWCSRISPRCACPGVTFRRPRRSCCRLSSWPSQAWVRHTL